MRVAEDDSQKYLAEQSTMVRVSENYSDDYSMWGSNGIDVADPVQGYIGDCWIIAAASCVAQTPHRIEKVFLTEDLNNAGVYSVQLYVMGIPV